MKKLITALLLLVTVSIAGCGSIAMVRNKIFGDPDIAPNEKIEYAKYTEHLVQSSKDFKYYHWLAVSMLAMGAYYAYTKRLIKAATSVMLGLLSSAWAEIAPRNDKFVLWFLVVTIILCLSFLVHSIIAGKKKSKEATDDQTMGNPADSDRLD